MPQGCPGACWLPANRFLLPPCRLTPPCLAEGRPVATLWQCKRPAPSRIVGRDWIHPLAAVRKTADNCRLISFLPLRVLLSRPEHSQIYIFVNNDKLGKYE